MPASNVTWGWERLWPWCSIVLFVLLAFIQANEPLHLDNMDFPAVARATMTTGLPVYYRGEDNPAHLGLYHPPLYIYTLALWFKIFGTSLVSGRAFGVVCALLAGVVVLRIVREMFGRAARERLGIVFWPIYLLNPFALQGFATFDIDSSIYGPLILATLLAAVRVVWRDGERRATPISAIDWVLIVAGIFLILWAKLTTVLVLPIFIAAILSERLGVVRGVIYAALMTIAAATSYAGSYELYGYFTKLDTSYTYRFVIESFLKSPTGGEGLIAWLLGRLSRLQDGLIYLARWGMGPTLIGAVVVGVYYLYDLAHSFVRGPRSASPPIAALVVLAFGLFVTAYYSALISSWGNSPFKYVIPAWPILCAAAAVCLVWASEPAAKVDAARVIIVVSISITSVAIGLLVIRDGAIFGEPFALTRHALVSFAAAAFAALFIVIMKRQFRSIRVVREAILAAAVAAIALNIGTSLHQVHADYSIQYDYGQRGFPETVRWIREHTADSDVIVSMKDIGFAANRRYLENYLYIYVPMDSAARMAKRCADLNVKFLIFTEGFGQDQLIVNPELQKWVAANAEPVTRFFNYVIYQIK